MRLELPKIEESIVPTEQQESKRGESSKYSPFRKKHTSEKKRKQKRYGKKQVKKILHVHPVKGWGEREEEGFIRYTGGFFEIVKMNGHNLFGIKQEEFQRIMNSYAILSSLYEPALKIVSIDSPIQTTKQQHFYKQAYQQATQTFQKTILEKKYSELSALGKYRQMEEYYVFIFGYDEAKLRENLTNFYMCCGLLRMEQLSREKKVQLLFRMGNPMIKFAPDPVHERVGTSKRRLDEPIDVDLLVRIQPQGNLKFHETAVQTGSGWSTCVHTYRLPSEPNYLWLHPFTKIKNKLLVLDVATQEDDQLREDIAKALNEFDATRRSHKDATTKSMANDEYHALLRLSKNIRKKRDILKFMHIRLYLYADRLDALEKRVIETKKLLEKEEFGVANLTLEQKEEWQALFLDYYSQEALPNRRTGLDVSSSVFGASYPANQVYKMDERGQYIGLSNTGSPMILDFFELDENRTFYNILLTGLMGNGKTTLMKKILYDSAGRGYMIRGFDKSGEFTQLVHALGGTLLRLDGQDGRLNIFEIFPLAIHDQTLVVDEKACMVFHQSKLATWYSLLKPESPTAELDIFDNLVDDLYVQTGFKTETGEVDRVTNRPPEDYPILTDLLSVIQKEMKQATIHYYEEHLFNIETTLKKLMKTTNDMFNGPTTVPDLSSQQILFFNIDGLTNFDQRYVNAQLFNAFNLFQSTMFNHGRRETKRYVSGEQSFAEIKRSMFFMAEAHNLLNQNNPRMVNYFNMFGREARKRFSGLCLDTQSNRCLITQGENRNSELNDIYDFMQYRFFFRPGDKELKELSEENGGDLTAEQVSTIERLKPHQALLKINTEETYELNVYASSEELALFDGGGRKESDG